MLYTDTATYGILYTANGCNHTWPLPVQEGRPEIQ